MNAAPPPLHMGWIVLWSFVLWMAGGTLFFAHSSPGLWEDAVFYVAVHLSYALLVRPLVGILWTTIIWGVYSACNWRRYRTTLLLLPTNLLLIHGAWLCITDPPSPKRFFAHWFHAALPASAADIKVRPPVPADPGLVSFYFRCSKADSESLVRDMGVLHANFLPGQNIPMLVRLPGAPNPVDWPGIRYYARRDGKTGTGYIIAANEELEQVVVHRDPLWSKTDDELTGHDGTARSK